MKMRIILLLLAVISFAAPQPLCGQGYNQSAVGQSQYNYEVRINGRLYRTFKTEGEAKRYVNNNASRIKCEAKTLSGNYARKGDKSKAAIANEMAESFPDFYKKCVEIRKVPVSSGNIGNSMPWQQSVQTPVQGSYTINQMEALSYFEPMPGAKLQKMISNKEYTEKATPEDKERMINAWYMEASAKESGQITSEEATERLSRNLSPTVTALAVRTQSARVSPESRQPGLNKTMSELGKTGLVLLLNEVQNPEVRAKIFDTLAQNCKNESDGRINTDILKSSIDLMQQRMSNTSQTNKALSVQNQNRNQGLNVGNSDRQDEKARQAAMRALEVYKDMCKKGFCKD